jgi:hypothetical protein
MFISEIDKDRVLSASASKLLEVIEDFVPVQKSGSSYVGKCPFCKEERGLSINPAKEVFSCFKCNQLKGKTPLDFLMRGMNKTFPESIKYLADFCGIVLDVQPINRKTPKPVLPVKKSKVNPRLDPDSFCWRMLAGSGLDYKDVKATIFRHDDNKSIFEEYTFEPGTVNDRGEIIPGDDAIIRYYDLDGMPLLYEVKDSRQRTMKKKEYFRVRWQFEHEHPDKEGKPTKYRSPYGSGTPIYIPQRVREAYKAKKRIDRLFIQEGEKKAEKASKHGLLSVAVSGIQNIAYNGVLPEDLIRIIQECQVKEVCFLLDSDWNDLSHNIKINDPVDRRPRAFFSAVKNYKEYMRTLTNREIYVEIYFGYVRSNAVGDKGIDDLLANSLKGNESAIIDDVEHLINEKHHTGKFLQLHKITSISDQKLEEFWSINSPRKFAQAHYQILKDFPEFKIGRHKWRLNEVGELESAQPLESDEQYWEEIHKTRRDGTPYTEYEFRYVRCRRFLQNRGFGRYRQLDGKEAFVHLTPPTVRIIDPSEARDFLFEFTESNCNESINEMISKGVSQYVGPDKLKLLSFINPSFLKPARDLQYFYFTSNCWKVTIDDIIESDYTQIRHQIWSDQKKDFPAKKLPQLIDIWQDASGAFSYSISPEGQKCHFLRFLENASNFTWRKEKMIREGYASVSITDEERQENIVHFISKLCSIGYLLIECKDPSTAKAVVAMDGKQSTVGESNGRSGKSLVGEMLKCVRKVASINGKKRDMDSDNFLWNDVEEDTRIVFIDDVRQGYVFEDLFFCITGDWTVNKKGGLRMTIPFELSPKIYLTTNHALRGDGSSHKDRQWLIAFSDYYNDKHKPIDDFGLRFFSDWDFDQWNLCWNMLAMCIQTYLIYGVVEAPGERLEQRQLRQEITEDFIAWADEYFSDSEKRNNKIPRKDLTDKFFEYAPLQRKYITATEFKKKIVKYCKWKGYVFNPQRFDRVTGNPIYFDADGRPDIDDKSGGVEYFTIGDADFEKLKDDLISDEGPF